MKIEIKQLKKSFADKLIIDINQQEFAENKSYCIRGRNGTGKTTLVKMIAGLLESDEGEILYNQQNLSPSLMKKMTYVAPNPYIFNMSVRDNILYPLRLRDKETDFSKEINDYLAFFELESLKNQNAKSCSSGEKMKIALSRAFIFKPEVLILDEPTSNLDVESIEKLKQKLLEVKKETTIIFISHNVDFIKSISDEDVFLGG